MPSLILRHNGRSRARKREAGEEVEEECEDGEKKQLKVERCSFAESKSKREKKKGDLFAGHYSLSKGQEKISLCFR